MRHIKSINLYCFLFLVMSFPLLASDWDRDKFAFPEEDPEWLSHIQPGTEDFSRISNASKSRVLERVLAEKKKIFIQLVEEAGNIILYSDNRIVNKKYLLEWRGAFTSAQKSWLSQLELEGNDHLYADGSLGGNSSLRSRFYFMISQLDERMKNIKERWWYKDSKRIAGSISPQ